MTQPPVPVSLLAYTNSSARPLPSLEQEYEKLNSAFASAQKAGICKQFAGVGPPTGHV